MSLTNPANVRSQSTTDTWITPKWIIDRFGPFDLDPCAADTMPWSTAKTMMTKRENGLLYDWRMSPRVWLNPPYGRELGTWLERMRFCNGLALVFARTDTQAFHEHVWPHAKAILFLRKRIVFCSEDGIPAATNAGCPSVLIAYGSAGSFRLWQRSRMADSNNEDLSIGKLCFINP